MLRFFAKEACDGAFSLCKGGCDQFELIARLLTGSRDLAFVVSTNG